MCVANLDPKTRWMTVFANLSLAAALIWLNFMRRYAGEHPWADGLAGLFLGVSIGINLLVVHRRRYPPAAPAGR